MDDFYDNLQELIINQARNIINMSLYTKALLSTLPVALIATDQSGKIRSINQAAEDILGINEKTTKDKTLLELFGAESKIGRKSNQCLHEGRPLHLASQNLQIVASGKTIVGNIYLQPLKDEEDEACGLLMTVEDTTYVHFLHDAFKRYVPPKVSEIIAQDPRRLELGGEEKVLSVLFSDLFGFTTYSEQYSPHEMVKILSDYFAAMTEEVFTEEGTLKEYVGDELMAIFGAPVDQPDHPIRACKAALAMKARLAQLRRDWIKLGRPPLRARIGINTGPMLVGNLGSIYRFSYGVLGDNVNLASRLEGLNNIYGTEILIGENTASMVEDHFHLREIDMVKVKGRNTPVKIYELIGSADTELSRNEKLLIELYGQGMDAYRKRFWTAAVTFFSEALSLAPVDKPSGIMISRCQTYIEEPPPEDWNGVFQHNTKR